MPRDPQYLAHSQKALQALRATPVFTNLSDIEFRMVTDLLKPVKLNKAKFVTSLTSHAELDLYLMRQGRASSRAANAKYLDDVQRVYNPGDLMNLEAFVAGKDSAETIEALTPLDMWMLPYEAFHTLLEHQPDLKKKLGSLPNVQPIWAKKKRYPFVPDRGEVVLMVRHKHWYVLLTKLLPVALMLLAGLLLWRLPVFMPEFAPFFTLPVVGVWMVITLILALWFINDWADDFYAVTNRRVIHLERVLFFSNRQSEAPLGQIRGVVSSRTNIIANTLLLQNMGDVVIETLNSYHPIVFANVDKPEEISRAITKQWDEAKKTEESSQRDVIRNILRAQMNIVERPGNIPKPSKLKQVGYGAPEEEQKPPPKPLPIIMGSFFLPLSRAKDDKGNITYRRHPLQLLQTAGKPLLATVGYCVALGAAWQLGVLDRLGAATAASLPLRLILIALLAAIFLVLVCWLLYSYEDWRNDLFLLTKDKLIDIDRTPLGIQGVQENVTGLDKVQNVTSSQKGFIEWLFDMGNVTIETGGDKKLVFEHVKDPRQIQRDIAEYMFVLRSKEKAGEIEKRHKEMADMINIYNEMLNLPYDQKTFKQ